MTDEFKEFVNSFVTNIWIMLRLLFMLVFGALNFVLFIPTLGHSKKIFDRLFVYTFRHEIRNNKTFMGFPFAQEDGK